MNVLKGFRLGSGALVALMAATVMSTGPWLEAQGGGPVLSAEVLGPNVTFTWTGVDGATGYQIQAGVAPGPFTVFQNVGNVTTFSVQAPAVGSYVARVVASTGAASSTITLQVNSMFVPPAAPTNFAAYLNGRSVVFAWEAGAGGGPPTSMVLSAGSAAGLSDIAQLSFAPGTQFVVPVVPTGTYFVRVTAANPGGTATSNEIQLVMPAGGGCSAPPARTFTTAAFGRYVQFSFIPVPGAAGYEFRFSDSPGGPTLVRANVGPNANRYSVNGAPLGTFYGTMTTAFACGSQTTGPETAFTIDGAPPPGPRTPNPAPGARLDLPNMQNLIIQLANERRDLLLQSCAEHGGNNRFMFEAVRRLRAIDNRWGLNWKRGNVGDLSQDIVNYNFGRESDEGTTDVYIIDIIGGHCGPNPSWAWIDQTEATRVGGAIGRWTLIPYLDAGYPIVSDPQQ